MLLLDSEALSALAQGPPVRRDSVRTLIAALRERGEVPETVAAVLAEVVRGRRQDAGVFAGMRRERLRVLPVDTRLAVRAGELLGAVGAGSEMAVDAFLVAAGALDPGTTLVVTGDPTDVGRLAEHTSDVTVVAI